MNRIGQARRLNRATNPISSPRVMAPDRDPPRTHHQQQRGRERGERVQRRLERRPDEPGLDPIVSKGHRLDRQALDLRPLASERLHDERAVDRLVGDGGHLADPLLRPAGRSLHPPREALVHEREGREQDERHHRHEDVRREQLDQGQDDQDDHAGGERDGPEDVHGRLHVGLHVRQELAGGRLPVIRERELAGSAPRSSSGGWP